MAGALRPLLRLTAVAGPRTTSSATMRLLIRLTAAGILIDAIAASQRTMPSASTIRVLAPMMLDGDSRTDPVRTECGDVVGVTTTTLDGRDPVDVYHGVRYATAKRWKAPQSLIDAAKCWEPDTFDAAIKPNPCVGLVQDGIEDCLTLTLWAPNNRSTSSKLPVIVFFHGGDFIAGEADGVSMQDRFASHFGYIATHAGGAIVADVNYRLALGGFFSIEAMQEDGAFGFQDALEALRWIKRNAHAFGGDPKRVTMVGQSSGGTLALVLAASPLSAGLISGVMALSASSNVTMSRTFQRAQHWHIVEQAGCSSTPTDHAATMSCLRSLSLEPGKKLANAVPQSPFTHMPGQMMSPSWDNEEEWDIPRYADGINDPGLAVVDGHVLRRPLQEALAMDSSPVVPIIISSMAQEQAGPAPFHEIVVSMNKTELRERLKTDFTWNDGKSGNVPFGYRVADAYAQEIAFSPQFAMYTIASDIQMTCGSLANAQAAARRAGRKAPVYLVHNEMHEPGLPTGGILDHGSAFHGFDLVLATATRFAQGASQMRDIWYEFASTGRVSAWKAVDSAPNSWSSVRLYMGGSTNIVGYKKDKCDFWKAYGLGGPEFWWSN